MMGKADKQMQLIIFDIKSMFPQNHLLRQIKNGVNENPNPPAMLGRME